MFRAIPMATEELTIPYLTKCTNFSKWAIHHLKPLKTYAERRVLLLGDAVRFSGLYFITHYLFPQAHATGPHQGNGAGQAVEVAYILHCLSVM